jgi:hypothetical protein
MLPTRALRSSHIDISSLRLHGSIQSLPVSSVDIFKTRSSLRSRGGRSETYPDASAPLTKPRIVEIPQFFSHNFSVSRGIQGVIGCEGCDRNQKGKFWQWHVLGHPEDMRLDNTSLWLGVEVFGGWPDRCRSLRVRACVHRMHRRTGSKQIPEICTKESAAE